MPPEIQKLGRGIGAWFDKIANFHLARFSNGPTEALNDLIKRIKRIDFGFRNFENYRIRACFSPASPTGVCSVRSSSGGHAGPRQNPKNRVCGSSDFSGEMTLGRSP